MGAHLRDIETASKPQRNLLGLKHNNTGEGATRGTYQLHKLKAAFLYIKDFRHAVYVGAELKFEIAGDFCFAWP